MTEPTTGSVRSKDGTEIGYQSIGQGPGLVIVHGGMEWGRSHPQLATELSDTCTVFLPDRRGRGRSGPYGEGDDVLDVEVEDLDALPAATGARQVLGVSSGAIIVLRAATMLPALERVVAFEPPLPVHPSFRPEEWMPLFDRRIEEDDEIGALTTALLGAQLGPPILSRIPRRVVEFLTRVLTAAEERKAGPDDMTMRRLVRTFHYDGRIVLEMTGRIEEFREVRAEVLLLGGSRSPVYLKAALDRLADVLPRARRVELPGLGHGATGDPDQGGRPVQVAPVLREFLTGQASTG